MSHHASDKNINVMFIYIITFGKVCVCVCVLLIHMS